MSPGKTAGVDARFELHAAARGGFQRQILERWTGDGRVTAGLAVFTFGESPAGSSEMRKLLRPRAAKAKLSIE